MVPMDISVDHSYNSEDDTLCSHPTDQPTARTSDAMLERDSQNISSDLLISVFSDEDVGGIQKIIRPDIVSI